MSAAIDLAQARTAVRHGPRRRFNLHPLTRSLCGMEQPLGQPVDEPGDAALMLACLLMALSLTAFLLIEKTPGRSTLRKDALHA